MNDRTSFASPKPQPAHVPLKLIPMDLQEAFCVKPPPIKFVWPAFACGTVGTITAAGSTGKTFLALQSAICLAAGSGELERLISPGFDFPYRPKGGRVIYFGGEDPPLIVRHRLYSIIQSAVPFLHDEDPNDPLVIERRAEDIRELTVKVCKNLQIVSTLGLQVDVLDERTITELITFARRVTEKGNEPPLLEIYDTFSRFHRVSNENDNGGLGLVMGAFERMVVETDTSVIALHHVSKAAATSGTADQQTAGRGASSVVDNGRYTGAMQTMTPTEAPNFSLDGKISIEETGDRSRFVRFAAAKANYSEKPDDFWLRRGSGGVLRPVDLIPLFTPKTKKDPTNGRKKA